MRKTYASDTQVDVRADNTKRNVLGVLLSMASPLRPLTAAEPGSGNKRGTRHLFDHQRRARTWELEDCPGGRQVFVDTKKNI